MKSLEPTLITLYDLKRILIQRTARLKKIALLAFVLVFFWVLFQKPHYLAKASFKHLGKSTDLSQLAKDLFKDPSLVSDRAPLFAVMHSNRVLKSVIEELGMQIRQKKSLADWHLLQRAYDTLKSDCTIKPADPDCFHFRTVSFPGEKPYAFYLKPITHTEFEIWDSQSKFLDKGEVGKMLHLPACSFVVRAFPQDILLEKVYAFRIEPWMKTVERARRSFEVRAHQLEKNVFSLYFKHSDRHLAAEFLNLVMESYRDFYKEENEEICVHQLGYLEKRQNELIAQFDSALKEHVAYLKRDIYESGCMGFSHQLDILAEPHNQFNAKLFDVDLELKRVASLYAKADPKTEAADIPAAYKTAVDQSIHGDLEAKRMIARTPAQEAPILDCDALTLQSAKALYLQYTEKKDRSESALRDRIFLRERISDPDFELSSLSTFLTDPVSLNLTQQASSIALKIKDGENRTAREQERLKEELETQRKFLHQHLTNMIELEKLQLKLLSHKIDGLQMQTLELLDAEKHLLQEKIAEFKSKMSALPEKWHREILLSLKKDLSARIIQSMTQLVETKSLNQKLYHASSKHLDRAYPPLKAIQPHLLPSALFAAFLACFVYYLCALARLLLRGFPVSHVTLRHLGHTCLGVLSPRSDRTIGELDASDLSTIRATSHFIAALPTHSCIALLTGSNPDFSAHLAEMLSFSGKKILRLHYPMDNGEQANDVLPIHHREHYDEILAGERGIHAADRLTHPDFLQRLSTLKPQYDYILLVSNAAIASSEGYLFQRIADALILSVSNESAEDLTPYKTDHLAFVCFN